MKIVKLKFKAPIHIHGVANSYDKTDKTIHSDVLYAAIMQTWATMGMTDWIPKSAEEQEDFAISSLFPFTENKEDKGVSFFFPRIYKPFKSNKYSEKNAKKVKKIEWIDFDYFMDLLKCDVEIDENHVQDKFLARQRIDTRFMKESVNQRNASVVLDDTDYEDTDDKKQKSTTYYVAQTWFAPNSGLFFLYDGNDNFFDERFLPALRLLADEGLGTDKNLGYGIFEFECENLPTEMQNKIDELKESDCQYSTNLSLFCPPQEGFTEIVKNAKYEILKREGFVTTPAFNTLRKKPVYMFREGGIFCNKKHIFGKTMNLKPDNTSISHPVWRVGRSIFLPIKVNSHEGTK